MDKRLAACDEGPAHHDERDPDIGTDSFAYQTAGQLGGEERDEENLDRTEVSMTGQIR